MCLIVDQEETILLFQLVIRKIHNENLLNPSISLMGRILDWIVLRIFKQKDKWLAVVLQPIRQSTFIISRLFNRMAQYRFVTRKLFSPPLFTLGEDIGERVAVLWYLVYN